MSFINKYHEHLFQKKGVQFTLYILILFPFIISPTSFLSAQTIPSGNERKYYWPPSEDTLSWPETIIPGSIIWKKHGELIEINYICKNNIIRLTEKDKLIFSDSVWVHFTVLPYPFHQRLTVWDSTQIKIIGEDFIFNPFSSSSRTDLFESSGLLYNGALTRGFSIGNNQSLVLDSELNLQLNGNIGDGYEIKAAITDNNLPIQADGTTRQIQDFDKVFIQVQKDRHSILAGDFDFINPAGYFMRYNRKLKGAQYSYNANTPALGWSVKGSAAVSRGKFTRQTIMPAEGNHGPYPLRGENGELFIIVLSGSEKVYLDGQLLIRGEDADYSMDYNQGEITFTRKILINSRHRITIEFEYAQFNFQRSQNAFETRYQKNKWNSYLNFYQENDSKTITGDLEVNAEDLAALMMAGDQTEAFFKSGIRTSKEGFNSNLILYTRKDTVAHSVLYPDILEWSSDPEHANLIVTFSDVGFGNGDYRISTNPSPNGRVYEWVAPDPLTGMPGGNFSPIIPLQAPQQRQMLTAGGQYQLGKNGNISMEAGLSRQDLNRYSSLDDEDNTGLALKLGFSDRIRVGTSWTFLPVISYEGSGSRFKTLDPYRNPEFTRDWNVSPSVLSGSEHLPSIRLGIQKGRAMMAQYTYDGLFRTGSYDGQKHAGQIRIDTLGWKLDLRAGVLNASDRISKSEFLRPAFNLERVIRKAGDWRVGVNHFRDKNEIRHAATDTLLLTSFVENKWSFYLRNNPEELTHLQLSYNLERPQRVFGGQLGISEKVQEWNVSGHMLYRRDFKVEYTLKHRDTRQENIVDPIRSQNILGRLDIRSDLWQKVVKWSSGYEIGNGQEPKVEYKYIKVRKGEGHYIWVDDGDGIEEINEFEPAPFPDEGEYLRLNIFSNTFIRTRALGLQQSLQIDPRQITQSGLWSKITLVTTYQMSRRIAETMDSPYWNPFYNQYADTSIIGYADTWRNILYWNRSNPKYDLQLTHVRQHNQNLQTSGFEARSLEDIALRARMNLRKKMDLLLHFRNGTRDNRSQFFSNKTFRIAQIEAGPELNVVLQDKFRLTGSYQHLFQKVFSGTERFASDKISIDGVWRTNQRTDIRSQISVVNIRYQTADNQFVDYAILQGLQDGVNILWTAQLNTRLNESLILTIQYNGRKTGDVRAVHTGSAQMRANF